MSTQNTPNEPDGGTREPQSPEPASPDAAEPSQEPPDAGEQQPRERAGPGEQPSQDPPAAGGQPPHGAGPLPPLRGRRLDRRAENRVLAGVAGGLGDYFGVDPAIFRLAFVALALFGGSGFILYGLGWLFLPVRGAGTTVGDDLVRRVGGGRSAGGLVLLAIAALVIVENTRVFGGGLIWAAILIGIGVLLFRGGSDDDAARPEGPGGGGASRPAPEGSGGEAPGPGPQAADMPGDHRVDTTSGLPEPAAMDVEAGSPWASSTTVTAPSGHRAITSPAPPDDGWRPTPQPAPPDPPTPPSVLGRATVAAALIMVGAAALLENLTVIELAGADYVALGLAVIGGGLIVGARVGRARGLIALGALGVVGLVVTSTVTSVAMASMGEREYVPLTVEQIQQPYELGLGVMRLDLTELALEPGQDVDVEVDIAVGSLEVEVPDDVGVVVDARAQLGDVTALGRESQGSDAATAFAMPGDEGSATIALDLAVGMGEIVVERTPDTVDTLEGTN